METLLLLTSMELIKRFRISLIAMENAGALKSFQRMEPSLPQEMTTNSMKSALEREKLQEVVLSGPLIKTIMEAAIPPTKSDQPPQHCVTSQLINKVELLLTQDSMPTLQFPTTKVISPFLIITTSKRSLLFSSTQEHGLNV